MRATPDAVTGIALDSSARIAPLPMRIASRGFPLNHPDNRQDAARRVPLREHVAEAVRRYLHDLDGCDTDDLYSTALRELEIPLFVEVLRHCDGNQSRAAAMLGIHRATLRKKLRDYGMA